MRLELARFIESDLDDIAGHIAQDNPQRAVTFIREIRVKFQEIRDNPLLYQLPRYRRWSAAWRSLVATHFSSGLPRM